MRIVAVTLAASLLAITVPQWVCGAESLPASVTACANVSDVLQRLACFDREVGRYTQRTPVLATPSDAAGTTAGAPLASRATPSPVAANTVDANAQSKHVIAHIVGIEGHADAVVVQLDNGQVWEQSQKADATLNLRMGDRVTIDKGLGSSYWLAGPSQTVMQVKQKL